MSDVESCDEKRSLKKTNKPMMEKKRRARINHCLCQLKEILIADKHASAGHAKWEKADILEMTVEYVKKIREAAGFTAVPRPCKELLVDETEKASDATALDESPTTSRSSSELVVEETLPQPRKRRHTTHNPLQPSAKLRAVAVAEDRDATPPASAKRRDSSRSATSRSSAASSLPHPMPTTLPPMANFNAFMAQNLLALQYQQHSMKIAAAAPSAMLANLTHPFPMLGSPWRM